MRVLHVIPAVANRYGGPSAALRGMTVALASRGLSVTVATTDADGPARLAVPLDGAVVEGGVTYRYFGRSAPGEYKFSWPLTRWLYREVRSFDVIHIHALFSYSTAAAARLAARARVPFILRPLGTLGAWSLGYRSWKKRPYLRLVERRHLRDAAALHATSDVEAGALASLGYAGKTRVIPLGVDVLDDLPVPLTSEQSTGPSTRPVRLLFLSRLHPVKNLPLLLNAVALLGRSSGPRVDLTVAGEGEPAYEEELRRLVATLDLSDRVRFVGRLEGEAKERAFDGADLFVLPSKHENFGIAAAEALARGVPALLSREVGIALEVERAGAGRTAEADASSLASAITSLACDRDRLQAMRRSALELARERYSWARCAHALERLYTEIVTP